MAKKKLDNIDLEMIQCEKDGYGVHYGWWKAKQPVVEPEPQPIPDDWKTCAFCGKPFKPKTGKQKYCDSVCSISALEKRNCELSNLYKKGYKVNSLEGA